jgi:SSS family solute:Na+ symporter
LPLLLFLLVLYSLGLIALGAWIGRRVRGTGDFFVSGRSLGAGLIFATFLAPNIGAGSTVGVSALAYRYGVSAWWWNGSAGIGSLVLAFWVGPRIWREASRLNLLTVGDFLEDRFGPAVRAAAALLIWGGTLLVLCAQLDGAATVLEIAGGLPHWGGCLVGTMVMTGYFVGGGLTSAARVNSVQLTVKLAGFLLATPLALASAGGWHTVANANIDRLDIFDGSSVASGWPLLLQLGPAFFLSPGLIQKSFAARNERALTRGIAANGVALMAFAFLPLMLGMTARALYPHLPSDQLALATVLAKNVPFAVGALALAAVFSAEMSAADAVLFMLSTSGARDVYKRFFRPAASDAQVLRAARVAAIVGGALGYGLTFIYPTVLDALRMFYAVLVVSLFAPVLGGLFLPRAGRRGALSSIVAGVAVLIATQILTGGRGYRWAAPTVIGMFGSGLTYLAFAFMAVASGRRSIVRTRTPPRR